MVHKCPSCSAVLTRRTGTCRSCGAELVYNGGILDALTYWDDSKNKYSSLSVGVMAAAVLVTALTHSLIPLAVGLILAGIAYMKSQS